MTRLLIVEDEWLTAQFIADIAIELGFEIKAISQNYEESLKYINSLKIDFVILDINIKGSKTGIEIAQMLKIKKIPFIFLTAFKDFDTIEEATSLSPLSYIIKPVYEEDIIANLMIVKNINKPIKQFPYSVNDKGMILKNNEIIILSEFERIIFTELIKNIKNIVSRDSLYNLLWESPDEINEGTLRNIVLKLRKKFNLQINNIKNIGYCLISD